MKTKLSFPELPTMKAFWAPIYMEPIMNSGERITIGIAAFDADGHVSVVSTLREEQVICAFGEAGLSLANSAQVCIDSLHAHLSREMSFSQWSAPLTGVEIGDPQETVASNLTSLIRLGMRLTSSFSALSAASVEVEKEIEATKAEEDRWPVQIRRAAKARAPQLDQNFDKRFQIVQSGENMRFGYVGVKYAANFGKLVPLGGMRNQVDKSRRHLWCLARLRDSLKMVPIQSYELILWRPDDNAPEYSQAQIDALRDNLYELEEEAKGENLTVLPVLNADEASRRIYGVEYAE